MPNDLNEAKRLNGLNDLNGFLVLSTPDAMRKAFKHAEFHRGKIVESVMSDPVPDHRDRDLLQYRSPT